MKTCSKCGIEKELSEFKKNKLHSDGFYSQCKPCVKSSRSTPEYKKNAWSSAKIWRKKNPSKLLLIATQYLKRNLKGENSCLQQL